jgi:anion-transporting  ArsA/GET3 family ATPase
MATQKIHFFTGKGGVGKSVVSAGYAWSKARHSKQNILLTELSEDSTFEDNLKPQKIAKNLSISHWNAYICLEEYASNLLRSKTLSKLFLNNSISKALINVAPGLEELAILGKATSGPRDHGPQMDYDEIFIDAFATGHFLNLMQAPQAFSEMFSFGPMGTQSKSIDKWIKDPDFSHVHIVTNTDELSIRESIELYKSLLTIDIKSRFIVNKFVDTEDIQFKKLPEKTKDFFQNIQDQQTQALGDLKKTKAPVTYLPQIFENQFFDVIETISKTIEVS